MVITFYLHGTPLAQPRPRVAAKGGVYYPQKFEDFMDDVRNQTRVVISKMSPSSRAQLPFDKAVFVYLGFIKLFEPTAKCYGDIDNLTKAVLDAFNGILYIDDSQIVEMHIKKMNTSKQKADPERYEPGVIVHITDSWKDFMYSEAPYKAMKNPFFDMMSERNMNPIIV